MQNYHLKIAHFWWENIVEHVLTNKAYRGKVLLVVPGFRNWFNVKHRDDTANNVFQLQDDYRNGDLIIVPMTAEGLKCSLCGMCSLKTQVDFDVIVDIT